MPAQRSGPATHVQTMSPRAHRRAPGSKREAEATAAAATIAGGEGGEGAKRRRTDKAAGMEMVEPPQVLLVGEWQNGKASL